MADTNIKYQQLPNEQAEGVSNNDPPPAYAPQSQSSQPIMQQPIIQQPIIQQPIIQQPQPVVIQPTSNVNPGYPASNVTYQYQWNQGNVGYPGNKGYNQGYQYQSKPVIASGQIPQTYAAQGQQPQVIIVPSSQPTTTIITSAQQNNNYSNTNIQEPYEDLTCLSCLACLFCGWICGCFALMFSSNAQAAHRRGNFDEYRRQQHNAK
eukprot:398652_1